MKNYLVAVLGVLLLAGVTASHAQDTGIFIKFTPAGSTPAVPGESTDPVYPGSSGWFEVSEFSISTTNPVTLGSAGGSSSAGRTGYPEARMTKLLNISSPALFRALTTGGHYDSAQLAVRNLGTTNQAHFIFDFKVVFLTSQAFAGASGATGMKETVQMAYGAFRLSVRPRNPDGSLGTAIPGQWDQINNTPTF